jgi:serine/threonine protein kinase
VALPGASTGRRPVAVEEHVTCHICKYLLQGALLGDCRVTRWIGSGAFGDVYEAEQLPPLNRRVAIKVMSLECVADGKSAELLAREVGAIAALDHPNILPILRVGMIEDGRSYLVMKFAAHGSLQDYCQLTPQGLSILPMALPVETPVFPESLVSAEMAVMSGASEQLAVEPKQVGDACTDAMPIPGQPCVLTPQQLLPYVEGAAAALQYVHDHGIIHLDVKPANLLLDSENRIMLADFGVSALLEGYTHASLHAYVGTPVYTAPEQWLEQPRTASDQYALAVTCYQLLTGRPPFTGNLYAIMYGHLQTPPPPLHELNPLIPPQVEAVILRALGKEPADRYQDISTFARAYREALEDAASTQAHDQQDTCASGAAGHVNELTGAALLTQSAIPPDTSGLHPKIEKAAKRNLGRTTVITGELTQAKREWKPPGSTLRPPHKSKRRYVVGLVVLVLLLVSGGALGFVRVTNPCLVGVCPGMQLSTNDVNMLNDAAQVVHITNTGSADLRWQVAQPNNFFWLTFSPGGGRVAPGAITSFTITTHTAALQNGQYIAMVRVTGQGVAAQEVQVTLSVQRGLSQVTVASTGLNFLYDQGKLQPSSQTITITNKSGHTFDFSIDYSENSWLQVTPKQGSLDNGQQSDVKVNVVIVHPLDPNTNLATVSIVGKLDNQAEPALLQSYDFILAMAQSPVKAALAATPPTSPQPFDFPTLGVQLASSNDAPTTLCSEHSMAWDSVDQQILLYGGLAANNHFCAQGP